MTNTRTITYSFAGGEVTSEFYGRIDDAKYQTGLALCRNMICLPHGPVQNRAGTTFVRRAKYADKKACLRPFVYSTDQSFALEFGHEYIRFHTNNATLLVGTVTAYNGATAYAIGDLAESGGVNYYCIAATTGNAPPNATYWYAIPATGEYEIPTPYDEADVFDLHFVQSQDVFTITHKSYAPMELRRYGATEWVLSEIDFVSDLAAPSGVAASPTGSGSTPYSYQVSALDSKGLEESLPSSAAGCNNATTLSSTVFNTVTWSAVSGASLYNVYKLSNGLYGYIGQTSGLTFRDDNIAADVSRTPPIQNDPFNGADNYPSAVSYYEQRRVFAGTINNPQNLWMTRAGTESNLSYSLPTRDEDSIGVRVSAREAGAILHAVPLSSLVLLTSSAEWRVTSVNTDVLTPTSISVKPQSYIGASNVQPIILNTNLIYAAARGGHLRELAYNWQANGYVTGDISLRAPHLFDEYTVKDLSCLKSPFPVIWAVSSSSKLIGCTYLPEQQVGSMHQHDTATKTEQSVIESCCGLSDVDADALYMLVKRKINGSYVRYIERIGKRSFSNLSDAYFVDCGATYSGAATDEIRGIDWLEGETVNILADGSVHPQRTVTGGAVTLDHEVTKAQVGLPVAYQVQTLPVSLQIEGFGSGRRKNVNKVFARVEKTSGFMAGPSFDSLIAYKQRSNEPYGSPPALMSKEIQINVPASWGDSGTMCISQTEPLPITICSLSLEVSLGS